MSVDPLRALLALRDRPTRRVIGLMSGTSADGVDAAVVEIEGHGPGCRVDLVCFASVPLPSAIRQRIWSLPDDRAQNIAELNFLLGETFAAAALEVMRAAGLGRTDIDLIGSHGQTVRHQPPAAGQTAYTLQIGEGAVIAERTGIPVVCDFRVGDVAAGGHGAPLIPRVDYLLFRVPGRTTALINLGGIANVTVVPERVEDLIAFDTGPANMPLDAVERAASAGATTFDADGARARRGTVDQTVLAELLARPYFGQPPPKSTGRVDFGRDFVNPLLDRFDGRLDDLMATLARLTIESIGQAFDRFILPGHAIERVLVSGGGVHNRVLFEGLAERLSPLPVLSSLDAGMNPDAKEALGFAVLANETLFCNPGNVPQATGARGPRVLGKLVFPPP